jgi:phage anti-repressor protein
MCPITEDDKEYCNKLPYKSILGQLLYIAITARPDIATAISECGRFAINPGIDHWKALLKIVAYLNTTQNYELVLGGCIENVTVNASSDSDWANDPVAKKSRGGHVVKMNNSPIIWQSKLQQTTALSSTEAEYTALSNTARELIWLRNILEELGFAQTNPSIIYQDNTSTMKIAATNRQLPAIKHIQVKHHFIRDKIKSNEITLVRKDSANMDADILTKNLPYPLFTKHRYSLKVMPSYIIKEDVE